MNCWISYYGIKNGGYNGFGEYPYQARSPATNSLKIYKDLSDVLSELCYIYDELIEKGEDNLGEILYLDHFFFCNTSDLVVIKFQDLIKSFNFCKTFSCPPYSSLDLTPANLVDDFLEIEAQTNKIAKIEAKKQKR